MSIEILMAKEAVGVLKRRPDKFKNVIGQYLLSFLDCEISRNGRAAYFFIRYMDDLLDSDRRLPNGAQVLPHVAAIRTQIETGEFTREPKIIELAEYSLDAIQKKALTNDNPKQDFLDVIDIMVFDYHRRQTRQELSAEQLQDYYQKTFYPLHNIMFICLGSNLRATDIPTFSLCQGQVYSIEHLQADWRVGIINIPKEVLKTAGLTSHSPFEAVKKSPEINAWAQNELQKSRIELLSLQKMLQTSTEGITTKIYNGLIDSMMKAIKKGL